MTATTNVSSPGHGYGSGQWLSMPERAMLSAHRCRPQLYGARHSSVERRVNNGSHVQSKVIFVWSDNYEWVSCLLICHEFFLFITALEYYVYFLLYFGNNSLLNLLNRSSFLIPVFGHF